MLYDKSSKPCDVIKVARELAKDSKKVKALCESDGRKYKQVIRMSSGEVTTVEKDD